MRQEAVELQGPAAGGRFGAAEHDADLLADLVDEDHDGAWLLAIAAGELAERLAHQPGLQADVRIADFAVEFLLGHEGGDRVDDDHVDRVRLDEHLGDLHRLFAVAGLADEQRFEVDAELLGPAGVEGVFGVDERGDAAGLLGLGDDVQGERGLAARFGAEDFDDAAAGKPWPPRAMSSDRLPVEMPSIGSMLVAAERHDRAFAELLFDGGDRVAELGAGFEHAGGLGAGGAGGLLGRFVGLAIRLGHTVWGGIWGQCCWGW